MDEGRMGREKFKVKHLFMVLTLPRPIQTIVIQKSRGDRKFFYTNTYV